MDVHQDTLLIASSYPLGTSRVPLADVEEIRSTPLAWADTLPEGTLFHSLIKVTEHGWIIAGREGAGFFLHRGDSVQFAPYIDPTAFMNRNIRVDEQRLAARSLMVSNDSILFLYGGRIVYPRGDYPQTLDVYDGQGRYAYSARLPRPAVDLIRFEDGYLAVTEEPSPTIWKWVPKAIH